MVTKKTNDFVAKMLDVDDHTTPDGAMSSTIT